MTTNSSSGHKAIKLYAMSIDERLQYMVAHNMLCAQAAQAYRDSIVDEAASRMSENIIGELVAPIGVVPDLLVNGKQYVVPMSIEEPSVVAAANHGAKMVASGFSATSHRDGIFGQILLDTDEDFDWRHLQDTIPALIRLISKRFTNLTARGGGLVSIRMHDEQQSCELLVKVNTAQAMGANIINSMLECMVQEIERIFPQLNPVMAIVSNYPSQLVDVTARVPFAALTSHPHPARGEALANKIARIAQFAEHSPYRAVTSNKGIMNGVDAVVAACGNDTRAVEAACHQLASLSGQYQPLSHWVVDNTAHELVGTMQIALPIGTVGGAVSTRPIIRRNLELMGSPDAQELSNIIAVIGLANNLAALHALAGEGIQRGHMRLQATQTAVAAGAVGDEVAILAAKMIANSKYSQSWAQDQLKHIREQR